MKHEKSRLPATYLPSYNSIMPPQRTPLGTISGNRIKNTHLSPYLRGKVVGASTAGAKHATIARAFNLDPSTVKYTILQDELRHEGKSLPRKRRVRNHTPTQTNASSFATFDYTQKTHTRRL